MKKPPTKDEILKELILFFSDQWEDDPMGTADFIAQGDWDVDIFVAAVAELKTELALRD